MDMTLLKEVLEVILAVLVIIAVIGAFTNLWGSISVNKAETQARETLNRFVLFLNSLETDEMSMFTVYSPYNYYLVSFDIASSKTLESVPQECFEKNCVCICKEKDCKKEVFCSPISLPLKKGEGLVSEQIKIMDISVLKEADKFLLFDSIQDSSGIESRITENCSGELVDVQNGQELKKSTAEAFAKAQEIAKAQGITLKIISANRDFSQQKAVWEKWDENPTYACNPNNRNCPHMTGCALDVCFGKLCISGNVPPKESTQETIMLENIMYAAGFIRYSNEWWHFEYGTDRWQRAIDLAQSTGQEVKAVV